MKRLLGPAEIRELAARLGVRPTKQLGQNFVHDPNTVRRIVGLAGLAPDDVVVEVGPGLGSLTLGLLQAAAHVYAVEIDPVLAAALPATVAKHTPSAAPIPSAPIPSAPIPSAPIPSAPIPSTPIPSTQGSPTPEPVIATRSKLTVLHRDALRVRASEFTDGAPSALVANLPYNVAVPVVLRLLAELPTLRHGLVMVQQEVADRLTAVPGSKIYGVPSVKLAWYASARSAGKVPPSVFWPVPRVDSGLVAFTRRDPPAHTDRAATFAVIDAAFAQRRKTLRAALSGWAGGADQAEEVLRRAGVAPGARGEALDVEDFARIARCARTGGGDD